MNRAFFAASLLFVGVVSSGCTATVVAPPEPTGSTTADLASFCQTYCTRINACDATSAIDACTTSCTTSNATSYMAMRPEVATLVGQCIAAQDCKSVLASSAVSSCSKDAAAAVAASDAANRFCDAIAASDTKCERTPDRATCLANAKLYTDETLNAAKSCASSACGEVTSCVMANLAVLTPAPQTKGCPPCGKNYTCESSSETGGGPLSTRLAGGRCMSNAGVLECDGTVTSRANGKKVGSWSTSDGGLVVKYEGASTWTCNPKGE